MNFWKFLFTAIFFLVSMTACNPPGGIKEAAQVSASSTTSQNFAGGTKGVKILLNTNTGTGSFSVPSVVPSSTPIPSPYPGANGTTVYNPGVSAATYYALDGTTVITKPGWLTDFQVGITSASASSACATFGGSGSLDVQNTYRVSEVDCGATSMIGSGTGLDKVFIRAVLNRDQAQIGAAENLLVQIEYQASALRLNTDGVSINAENNLDQLWKIFWNSTLSAATAGSPFSIFVPPNYSSCAEGTSGATAGSGGVVTLPDNCTSALGNKGAPIRTRQFIIPLSAYPTMDVIQLTRVKGRINNNTDYFDSPTNSKPVNYVSQFCTSSDSPLCLGVVIYSVTLMRM